MLGQGGWRKIRGGGEWKLQQVGGAPKIVLPDK